MRVSLRRTIAILAAYAVAVHGLLALSIFAAHVAGTTDHTEFSLCANAAGSGDGDHRQAPGKDQAHCLALCLAAGSTVGGNPDGRGHLGRASIDAPLSIASAAVALPPAAAATGANRSRAPPA